MLGRVLLAVCALAVLALGGAPGVASAAAPGLVAAYGFEESSGTSALDASGQGNAGSLVNGTARTTQGRFGSALSFDGTNDSVLVSDASSLNPSTGMTLEAWVNPVATDGWRTVVLKERNSDLSYALYGSGEGVPAGSITRSGVGGYTEAFGPAPLVAGSWTHLAATYDGATVRLYADGQQIATRAGAGTLGSGAGNLRIGGNSVWGEWFRGIIDEVRVYNRALPQSEIQADMAASVGGGDPTPPPPGPEQVGSWTPPADWPLVAVHGAMLSNGKVALWDGFGAAMRSERIWDPATGAFQPVPSDKNLFCAGHVLLPDGRLFVAGGHVIAYEGIRDTGLLNPLTGSWTAGPMMARARWYPTTTTLPDGKRPDRLRRRHPPRRAVRAVLRAVGHRPPEIYDPATNTIRSLPSAGREMPLYPFMFVTPDGRVVDAGPDKTTRILDVRPGQWSTLRQPVADRRPQRRSCTGPGRSSRPARGRTRTSVDVPIDQPRRGARHDPDRPEVARDRADEVGAHVPHADRAPGRRRARARRPARLQRQRRRRRPRCSSPRSGAPPPTRGRRWPAACARAATTTPRCCCPTAASCWPAAAASTAR